MFHMCVCVCVLQDYILKNDDEIWSLASPCWKFNILFEMVCVCDI